MTKGEDMFVSVTADFPDVSDVYFSTFGIHEWVGWHYCRCAGKGSVSSHHHHHHVSTCFPKNSARFVFEFALGYRLVKHY